MAAVALPAVVALAQQAPPGGPRPAAPGGKIAAPAAAAAAPTSDAGLQKRVEQLEEQLVDMQVLVGTLESLAKGATPPASGQFSGQSAGAPSLSVSDSARMDALETQVRALAAQLENLQEQLRSLSDRPAGAPNGGFGAVTIAPAAPKDDLDRVFPGKSSNTALQGGPGGGDDTPPQQLYERAYGYLLQKDYSTAETTFDDFLKRHSGHQLAGNAQYWLGETYYVRSQYRQAAAAFLKGYQDYSKSQKASESLLKLAMSLQRLGQKDAACSSFAEFGTKYPSPPAHIKNLAQTERQRSGC